MIAAGWVESAHDVSDGGLAVTLAECCLREGVGAAVDLGAEKDPCRWLFGEDPSRIVVSLPENLLAEVQRVASGYNIKVEAIGATGGTALRVLQGAQTLFEFPLSVLRGRYETALAQAIGKAGAS
jgi:phosphoribosylformylglycinamidine synthase